MILEQGFQLRHILDDNGHADFPGPHGGKDFVKLIRQRDVGKLIHDAVDMNRQPAAVFPVGQVVESLEKLGVNHSHQIIEGRIGVRNAAEQRHLPFPDRSQVQLIHAGQTADLVQVKGG